MADKTKYPLYSPHNVLIDSGNLVLGSFLGHGAHGAIYQATSLQKWQRSSFLVSPSAAASPVLAIRRLQKKRPPAPSVIEVHYAVKAVFSSAGETEAHLHSRASGHRGILTLHHVIREGAFMYFVLVRTISHFPRCVLLLFVPPCPLMRWAMLLISEYVP
jgi:hypothetical protein